MQFEPQAFALPNRVIRQPLVAAQDPSLACDDLSGCGDLRRIAPDEVAIIVTRQKA